MFTPVVRSGAAGQHQRLFLALRLFTLFLALSSSAPLVLSNREIAEKLFLSEGSVKQYVNQIYSKLHIEGDTRTKRQRLAELLRVKT